MPPGAELAAFCAALFLTALTTDAVAATAVQPAGERRFSFNDGWRFFLGDAPGAERPEFQDSQWRPIQLPHGWAIE